MFYQSTILEMVREAPGQSAFGVANVFVIQSWVMKTFIMRAFELINNIALAKVTFVCRQVVFHDHVLCLEVVVIDDQLQPVVFFFAFDIIPDNFLHYLFIHFVRTVHLVFVIYIGCLHTLVVGLLWVDGFLKKGF